MSLAVTEKLCLLRDRLCARIGATRYRTWFGDAARFLIEDDRLVVIVGNEFVRGWIASNFAQALQAVVGETLGESVRVVISATDDDSCETSAPTTPSRPPVVAPSAPAPASRTARPLRGDLDTYIVGASNQLAFSAAQRLITNPAGGFAPLVAHGGCGLGKTHLLQGVCNAFGRAHPTMQWRYVSGEEFTNEFIAALRGGRVEQFRAQQRGLDLLVVDDIHFLANKRATQEEFLHTFNAIAAGGKQVVFSSDRHPREIATLSEPLINRLISGIVIEIKPPDFDMRCDILRRRTAAMGVEMPPDAVEFIARSVTRNVRELEGALYKIVALASLSKEPLTRDIAKIAVEDYVTRKRQPEPVDIERTVGEFFGVTPERIRSKSRDRTVCTARSIALYLIRRFTHLSYPEIGRLVGSRNHSTVLMATQRVEESLRENGVVTWNTPAGPRSEKMRSLLEALEKTLATD